MTKFISVNKPGVLKDFRGVQIGQEIVFRGDFACRISIQNSRRNWEKKSGQSFRLVLPLKPGEVSYVRVS